MRALLWDDLLGDLASAKRHFGEAVQLHRAPSSAIPDYVTNMAFQHAMQVGYTSFEAAMKRLLHLLGEPLPAGPQWHAALLKRLARPVPGSRPALLAEPLLGQLEELRRFRHVAMHAYDDFALRKAAIPVEAAEAFGPGVDAALAVFRAAIDPPS